MSKILRLKKSLKDRPETRPVPGLTIRPLIEPDDVLRWLALRTAAFSGLVVGGRPWTESDFRREFSTSRVWIAQLEADELQANDATPRAGDIVGAVALGRAAPPPHDRAALQWLMVAPPYRRRGIGRALITVVEQTAWENGDRELGLETHADWQAALRLYERCGYAIVR